MSKINAHVEIARTENVPFSSMGSVSCAKIHKILSARYRHVGVSIINTYADLESLKDKSPDLVFLGLKKLPMDSTTSGSVWLPEYLDENSINYTGSKKAAIELDFNKERAKWRVYRAGLPTAPFFTALPDQYSLASDLPLAFPLFVKPLTTGGGKGVGADSVVRNFSEFQKKVADLFTLYGATSLVEQYLSGREFSVAILENTTHGAMIVPIEIITEKNAQGDRVLGSEVKSDDDEQVVPVRDAKLRHQIINLAKKIYDLLGSRDLGRIDLRMDTAGTLYFLEANLMPGPVTRYFAGAFLLDTGFDYESTVLRIVETSLSRAKTTMYSHAVVDHAL